MEPAVGDGKAPPAALLHVDNAGEVDPRLADQPAAEFDRVSGAGEDVGGAAQGVTERRADSFNIERRVAVGLRDAEAAAEVEFGRGGADRGGDLGGEGDGLALRLDQRVDVKQLAAGIDV